MGKPGNRNAPPRAQVEGLIAAFRSGRFEESLAGARRFIEAWPALGFGWIMTGASYHALGRLEDAAAAYRRALVVEPDNAEAHNNLGNILRELERYGDSVDSHERAIAIRPQFHEAYFNLGLSLAALKDYAKAEEAFRKVLQMRPGLADAHNHLGNLYKAQGRLAEAAEEYRRALAVSPRFAEVYSNLGSVLSAEGLHEEAETAYRRALEIKPAAPDLLSNLGTFLMTQGRLEEAEQCYRTALGTRPGSGDLHNNLGIALRGQGRLVEAAEAFERALDLKPLAPSIHHNLGDALMDLGRLADGEALHRKAIELDPASATGHRNLGVTLAVLGRPREALQSFRQALRLEPEWGELYYRLAEVKRFEAGDPDLEVINGMLERPTLGPQDRVYLDYAAGKAYADIGTDPDRSFEHYAAGARAKRSKLRYDVAQDEAELDRIARTFTHDLMDRISGEGCDSSGDGPVPILVVGMPRSGTTLIETILASHPRAHGAGERADLERLMESVSRSRECEYPDWAPDLGKEQWRELGRRYVGHLAETAPHAARIVDKMPNNFRHLGMVSGMRVNPRVIHVRRDPLDTCVSCFAHLFEGGQYFSYDLAELGRFYRAYERLMAHWRAVLPDGILLEVRYEDLVAEPEEWMRRMLAHCGLEWDPAVLQYHANRRAVPTASLVQVRQPIYGSAVGRWRCYARHLGPLMEALGETAADG